ALKSLSVSTSKGLMAKCARLYLPETLEISPFAVIPKKDSEILATTLFFWVHSHPVRRTRTRLILRF
ncbi:MAG: hypothetical protein WAV32_01070, partial [Halobacteriota archaeon]